MKLGKGDALLAGLGLFALAILALLLGTKQYESSWKAQQVEQPVKLRLEQSGIRFSTENDMVVDAFSPHSYIPESCLDDLAKFKKLKRLEMIGPPLSDDAIAKIGRMKQLEYLLIMNATEKQLQTLSGSLPRCRIAAEPIPEAIVNPPALNPDAKSNPD
jgi:hypothetical protein